MRMKYQTNIWTNIIYNYWADVLINKYNIWTKWI